MLEVTNRSHQKVSMSLLKIVNKSIFLSVTANEDLCNIYVTGSCVKLLFYPKCLGKKVVLSEPHELMLLWHQAPDIFASAFQLH